MARVTTLTQLIEAGARAAAKCCGLDYDEVCGVEADPDEGYCDSSTCVAALFEDHDPDDARGYYASQARATILAILPILADDLAGVAEVNSRARYFDRDRAKERKAKQEARYFEIMAIECIHIAQAIRTRVAAIMEGEG